MISFTILELFLALLCLFLLALLVYVTFLLYKFGILILNVQDTIEQSLQILDERSQSVEKILNIPLFFDSPEIKRLHKDMVACRDAVLSVAYILTDSLSNDNEK